MPVTAVRAGAVMALKLIIVASITGCAAKNAITFNQAYDAARGKDMPHPAVIPQQKSKTVTEEKIIRKMSEPNGTKETTKTTTNESQSLIPVAAPSRPDITGPAKVCPDNDVFFDPGKDGEPPRVSPCVSVIVRSAIDNCLENLASHNFLDKMAQWATAGSVVTAAAASGIALGAGASAPVTAAIGAGVLMLKEVGSPITLFAGPTIHQVKIEDMINAATHYLKLRSDIPTRNDDPKQSEQSEQYYAGLWNAVGSACPQGVFEDQKRSGGAVVK